MLKYFKLNNELYEYHDFQCQYTFGTHAILYITLDLSKNPDYKSKFISIYENKKIFDIISTKLISRSNLIKLIDIDKHFIRLEIKADLIETTPQDKRRDNIIEDLLSPTFLNNQSINNE